jgi:hypothetical protein
MHLEGPGVNFKEDPVLNNRSQIQKLKKHFDFRNQVILRSGIATFFIQLLQKILVFIFIGQQYEVGCLA